MRRPWLLVGLIISTCTECAVASSPSVASAPLAALAVLVALSLLSALALLALLDTPASPIALAALAPFVVLAAIATISPPTLPVPPLEQSINDRPYSVQVLSHWVLNNFSDALAVASVVTGFIVLATKHYPRLSSAPSRLSSFAQHDLPSDSSLYKAYLCRVFDIKSADVIDFTGHIDCDRAQLIGRGGSGDVWAASWNSLDKKPLISTPEALPRVVVKLIMLVPLRDNAIKAKRYKMMKRELSVWSKLNHPNILPLIGIACIEGDANLPALISPWMENGNVVEFLKKNPSFPPSGFLKDIIKGLHYLHTFNPVIVHGGIKGVDVLINHRKEACLSDFGLSRIVLENTLWHTSATQSGGSLRWMAPELLNGDAAVPTITSDIYAFGMTCYEILSRKSPFAITNDAAVISKVIKGQRPERVKSRHSDELWSIITRCWAQLPENRPSTEETLELVLQYDTPSNL